MSIVRDPILKPGFYWYDAPEKQTPGFQEWLKQHIELVKVRSSTTFQDPPHLFVVFEVLQPVIWLDAKQFGFPNTANSNTDSTVISSGAEPKKDALDVIGDKVTDILPTIPATAAKAVGLVAVFGIGYLLFKAAGVSDGINKRIRKYRASRNRNS